VDHHPPPPEELVVHSLNHPQLAKSMSISEYPRHLPPRGQKPRRRWQPPGRR
jgi:hypothetical protein